MNKSTTNEIEIDWDFVDSIVNSNLEEEVPKNGITSEIIQQKYGLRPSTARGKLMELEKTGKFDVLKIKRNAHYFKCLVPKKDSE